MSDSPRIFVAGHRGMVGSAILRELQRRGGSELLTRSRAALDLTDPHAVRVFFETMRPEQVYLAAAKVGGIHANNAQPAEFIHQNLMIQASVIDAAWRSGVQRLLFLGSSCIYPRLAEQPMREDALLTGRLEPTNEPYAIAKIAGIKLCESYNRQYGTDFRSVMPTNLYGPGDSYDLLNSHVIPAMLRKLHLAKLAAAGDWAAFERDENRRGPIPQDLRDSLHAIALGQQRPKIVLWGTGTPRREFLFVDDMAEACVHVMDLDRSDYEAHTQPMLSHLNIGTGGDVTIRALAEQVAAVVGFSGEIEFDPAQPDGAPRKLLDVSRIHALGWRARTDLNDGLRAAYTDYRSQ
jgi:GDP-L-fucose synthase